MTTIPCLGLSSVKLLYTLSVDYSITLNVATLNWDIPINFKEKLDCHL